MRIRGRLWTRAAVVLGAVIALDQLTKRLIADPIATGDSRNVLPGLQFVHTRNQGVAFGVLAGSSAVVVALMGVLLTALLFYFARHTSRRLAWLATGLLLGGALGNILDRLRLGAVTDFIQLPLGWPPFNVADMAITFGVFTLALVIEEGARERRPAGDEEANDVRAGLPE